MNLEAAIAELEAGQSHAEMLAQLRARTVSKAGMAQSGYVLGYLASIGKLKAIRSVAANDDHPLSNAADATLVTLQHREGFDFALPANIALLDAFVQAGILDADQAAVVIGIGSKAVPEFEGLTLKQVVAVREPSVLATVPVESAESAVIECSRHVGISVGITVTGYVPAPTSVELHIATSVDGVSFTPFRYAGAVGVTDAAAYVVNVNPQLTQRYNKIKFISKEYNLSFSLGPVGAY
jgi:hypothetical protein